MRKIKTRSPSRTFPTFFKRQARGVQGKRDAESVAEGLAGDGFIFPVCPLAAI